MIEKNWDPGLNYEILVREVAGGPTRSIYTGPWTLTAKRLFENSLSQNHSRRLRRHITERELQAFMYGHPDMVSLEVEVDRKRLERFYDEGDR